MLVLWQPCKLRSSFSCPYSPLGRGFLTGQIKSPDELAKDDYRASGQPRWAAGAFEQVKPVECRVLSGQGLHCSHTMLVAALRSVYSWHSTGLF